uniref:Rho GTPase activating protein 30 n=1 Tax=Podarcis muralis TaxID=64176 RepID=A0A670JNH5_PODMU
LRSKDIESCGFNGTAAFMEVRVQSIVVEFILTHVDQIFNNVPLSGSRESLRKSLLLASSPVTIGDDKYSFSCNIPAALNQGDGPPQMRPYHTIIELTDNKRKGSLKAKKWKSIFNLGRSSHDAKRKLNKSEDKDDKMGKMRLRPAKSMDSLSSMPCASDGSFDGPASLDNSFLLSESDEYTERPKAEEAQGESEGEATAKSEPTTPKASRSSLVGVAPQGRSPKTGRNRAEKCAGVHISGPFSVTVPFHITSNLSLSRLTRGLECPALSHCALEKDPSETSEAGVYASPLLESGKRGLSDSEENQMSLEVQDSFSFLDSQDAWLGESMDGDQPRKSTSIVPDFAGSGVDSSPLTEDDMSSGFMNEMIGGGMQLEMFSAVSPLDYLSIEECMNEHSEEEDDQYYLAVGCSDGDEVSKEVDSEEVYLSAFDDLSPLAGKLQHFQQPDEDQALDDTRLPRRTLDDQPFSLAGQPSPEDPDSSHLFKLDKEPLLDDPPVHNFRLDNSQLDPDSGNPSEEELQAFLDSGSDFSQLETLMKAEAETTQVDPDLAALQMEGINARGEDDLLLGTGCLMHAKCPDGIPENPVQRSSFQENQNHAAQPSLENERERHNALGIEQVARSPCIPSIEADGSTLEVDGLCDWHPDYEFPFQEAEQLQRGETALHPQAAEVLSPLDGSTLHRAPLSSLLDNCSENASSETSPMLAPSLEPDAPPERAPPGGSSPDNSNGSEASSLGAPSLQGCPESPPQTPPHSMPVKSSDALKHDLSDGSVSMRLTSHAIRVQQAKSFPVVPPKPQFAKIPPALMPISPTKEASLMWCSPPVPEKNCRNGIKEGPSEGSLRRWASWRNGNSMSFDEAVALAKERHVGQAPMRRMQTYCFGDVEGLYGPPRTEKPPPNPKPALKPLGQWPLRPLSCAGTAADAFVPGKPLLAPALPDIIPEGQLSPSLEALSLPQDLPPRRKLSLTKAGRRASNSEEVLLAAQQERR